MIIYARKISAIAHFVLLLFIFSGALATAQDLPAVTLAMDPASLVVGPEATASSGIVIVTIADGRGLPAMTLRSRPAKVGEHLAFIRFPDNNNKDWILLPAQSADRAEIQIEIVDVLASGVYEGLIEAMISGRQNVASTAKVAVYRADSNFAPAFEGEMVKNNRVEFTTSSSNREFVFSVQNPSTGIERVFKLALEPPTDATVKQQEASSRETQNTLSALSFHPATFRLRPGQEQAVVARVRDGLPSGSSFHVIKISDANTPTLSKNMVVALKVPTSPWGWPTWLTLGLVLLGAVLSLLLNNIFPPSLAKRRNRQLLNDSSAFIRNCTKASGFVQSALLAENSHIRLLNGQILSFSTTKAAQLSEIDRLIKNLEEKQQVAYRISTLRDSAARNTDLPARMEVALEEDLLEAEEILLDGEVENAKAKVEEATRLRTTGLSETYLKQFRLDLPGEIQTLLENIAGGGASNDPFISQCVTRLKNHQNAIATLQVLQLLALERDYHTVNIYMNFEEAVGGRQKFDSLRAPLLALLKSNSASPEVSRLLSLVRHDIALSDIETAIKQSKFSLKWAPKMPRAYELADFWFEFDNPQLQNVPAARRLPSFEWDFDDGISSPLYERARHFFQSRRGGWQSPWRKMGRKIPYTVPVTLQVKPPYSAEPSVSKKETITIREPASHGWGAVGIQLTSFGVSFILAVLLAFSTQYAVIPELNSFTAYLTPLLFGFSLDQIRDKTTT
jgi:hypothetical protein